MKKIILILLSMVIGIDCYAVSTPALYDIGFMGEGYLQKEQGNKTIKKSLSLGYLTNLEPNIPYYIQCHLLLSEYDYSEGKVPIYLHWRGFDESNMIYYINYQHVTPKEENGKVTLNLNLKDSTIEIQNVILQVANYPSTPDLSIDIDTTKHGIFYYCTATKDI